MELFKDQFNNDRHNYLNDQISPKDRSIMAMPYNSYLGGSMGGMLNATLPIMFV